MRNSYCEVAVMYTTIRLSHTAFSIRLLSYACGCEFVQSKTHYCDMFGGLYVVLQIMVI